MKKKITLFSIICLFVLFSLTGCKNKTAISTEDFKSKAEKLGYTTIDITSQYASYGNIKEATVATSNNYQVEFYVLTDEEKAKTMFSTNKTNFENYKGKSSTETSSSIGNYSSYTVTSKGYYMHICRVNNTLLYVNVIKTHKDSVKELIKELGY